ncbi:MAG: hypothetical protein ISS94_00905, partial [Candidatus Syntrophoarchaeum sp.]|nr:hypothetical protein [Candidatus Syntrophoarchaeum sp.]
MDVKQRKGVTLTDFLHLKKGEEEEKFGVESGTEIEGIEEEKGIEEKTRIYSVNEVTRYIRQRLDEDEVLSDVYVK